MFVVICEGSLDQFEYVFGSHINEKQGRREERGAGERRGEEESGGVTYQFQTQVEGGSNTSVV